ncbi:secretion protein HlyD family protein [Pseudodesulfovibrio mercurii]|uniref:Secretion protein HlyD family protein n=1 Tax=Pseudodesulfovibrio mercurii TaxID=641491 RepID=F0JIJ3_9BACT|nr:HlyD family efflux transporter periplasmic adaptor subunit [Pseudodesulfovibrio mercurii]EGB15427.1 secretion protein HlyD family protein [Pseudodesulfovibrio mercurii]
MKRKFGPWLTGIVILIVLGGGAGAWYWLNLNTLEEGFAEGNGRIEATEIDVAAKWGGKVAEVLADEGDYVQAGDVVARMDMQTEKAQVAEAEADLAKAGSALETARAQVYQRQAEVATAQADLARQKSQLDVARKSDKRIQTLVRSGVVSQQDADNSRGDLQTAQAAWRAARAQVKAAEAAAEASKALVAQAQANIKAAQAVVDRLKQVLEDGVLRAPKPGRVQYRVVEPGEVVAAGGKVVSLVDLSDVYMTFFLPEVQAGRTAMGGEARVVLDAAPEYVIPANISFVASVAQFTPKSVETSDERQKLMFRIKARIEPELLRRYARYVKTGLPGVAYVRLDQTKAWPDRLAVHLPEEKK